MSRHKPDRESREYPHSTGDRNAWAPTGERRQPVRGGGNQRDADPDVEPRDGEEESAGGEKGTPGGE